MAWFCLWTLALWNSEAGAREPSDRLKPPGWTGNFWGPEAAHARAAGVLPPLPTSPIMAQWDNWARRTLQEGDIVFRQGDARMARGLFPLSRFIACATGSLFSHAGIVALEGGTPVVYDCSSAGIQRQPFAFWMLNSTGALGVKRLKVEHRGHIPGVIAYCRRVFEQQVPFDYEFRLDDNALYCLELTENAFRSEGLTLSQPVRIGDWDHLAEYPITAIAVLYSSSFVLDRPLTLDQPVYLPGNARQGIWASPLLETVFSTGPMVRREVAPEAPQGLSLSGDVAVVAFVVGELHRSYQELPLQWLSDLVPPPEVIGLAENTQEDPRRAGAVVERDD
jgi:hypothetical protein